MLLTLFYRWTRRARNYVLSASHATNIRLQASVGNPPHVLATSHAPGIQLRASVGNALQIEHADAVATVVRAEVSRV